MRILIMMGVLLIMSGCDSHGLPPAAPKTEIPAQSQDGLFDTQHQALEKAKQVESTLQQNADAQRQALERETK